MAKPGEHTYAPITCARTNPTWSPLCSLSPLFHCLYPVTVHCVCNSSSDCFLSVCLVNMTFGVLTFLLTLASTRTADCLYLLFPSPLPLQSLRWHSQLPLFFCSLKVD